MRQQQPTTATTAPEPAHRQRKPKHIYLKSAKPEDFRDVEIGDWIQYIGDITTQYELNFIRNFGIFLFATHSTQAPASEPEMTGQSPEHSEQSSRTQQQQTRHLV